MTYIFITFYFKVILDFFRKNNRKVKENSDFFECHSFFVKFHETIDWTTKALILKDTLEIPVLFLHGLENKVFLKNRFIYLTQQTPAAKV